MFGACEHKTSWDLRTAIGHNMSYRATGSIATQQQLLPLTWWHMWFGFGSEPTNPPTTLRSFLAWYGLITTVEIPTQ